MEEVGTSKMGEIISNATDLKIVKLDSAKNEISDDSLFHYSELTNIYCILPTKVAIHDLSCLRRVW